MKRVRLDRQSDFIKRFQTDGKVGCKEFWVLHESIGACAHQCSYCYMKRSMLQYNAYQGNRGDGLFTQVMFVNYQKMKEDTQAWLLRHKEPQLLNAGEMGDPLSIQSHGKQILENVAALFRHEGTNPHNHNLLFVTKSGELDWLYRLFMPDRCLILSYTVNADEITERYEKGVKPLRLRRGVYLTLHEEGWRTRIRIDPIFPELSLYDDVISFVNRLKPERVTLGTPRMRPSDRRFASKEIMSLVRNHGDPDGRLRMEYGERKKIYEHFFHRLQADKVDVCKETWQMREDLGLGQSFRCNCSL